MATKATQHQPASRKRTEAGILKRVGEAVKIHGSYRWRKLSLYKRQTNPVCEWCSKHGKTREAVAVHHLQPIEVAPHLAYEISNLMSCCRDCHDFLEKHPNATVPPAPANEPIAHKALAHDTYTKASTVSVQCARQSSP